MRITLMSALVNECEYADNANKLQSQLICQLFDCTHWFIYFPNTGMRSTANLCHRRCRIMWCPARSFSASCPCPCP